MKTADQDERFICMALELAGQAAGRTYPNPAVGAVLVKRGKIIGSGYHKRAGERHAEIEAIKSAGKKAHGATLYVNLEPCPHFGRTPPCTDAIIRAGIKRVVCSGLDPNPRVRGLGIRKLKNAGLSTSIGIGQKEARALNEAFFAYHEKKRPFVALKFAASLDGKLATRTGDSKWITNEKARSFARGLRGRYQAILVGSSTILSDDPHLGVRNKAQKDPLRIILDSKLRIPLSAKVFRDNNALVAASTTAPGNKLEKLKKRGISVLLFEGKNVPVKKLLAELWKREIISIFVEGGGEVLGSFIDAQVVDKVYAFYAPIIIGGRDAVSIGGSGADKLTSALQFRLISIERLEDNIVVIGDAN